MIFFGYFCIFISISHVVSKFCEITERVEEPYNFLEQTVKEIKFKNCTIDQELDPNLNCNGSKLQTISQNVTKYQLVEKKSQICCVGYKKQDDDCIPICDKNCVNGDCIDHNICKCSDGFEFQDQSTNICIPVCNPKCENGYCVQPNICQCSSGYSNSIKFNYICEPFCNEACTNGFCAKPGKCECLDGFNSNNGDSNNCSKNCEPRCQNGVCDNGECICDSGFKLTAHLINNCLPFCEEECVSGFCLGGNVCGCRDGYYLINKTECIPDCLKNCENGTCVGPNLCKCFDGFTLSSEGLCVAEESSSDFLSMLRDLNRLTYFYIGLGAIILLLLLLNYCLLCSFCRKSKGSDLESKKLSNDF